MSSADPECLYGLAQMLIDNQTLPEPPHTTRLEAAVDALEQAARHGHAFAAYNLGIAHLHGLGVARADAELAAEWFGLSPANY